MENISGRVELDYVKQVGSLPPEDLIRFYEIFAHALTVSVRGIWSDETLNDSQKVEVMKWLNEIMHQVVLKSAGLRLNQNELSEVDTWEMIQHYVSLCPEIGGHVAVACISSYQRVVGYTAPPNNSFNRSANRGVFIRKTCLLWRCARPVNSSVRTA
jgi:hypothetical protein